MNHKSVALFNLKEICFTSLIIGQPSHELSNNTISKLI